MTDTAYAHEPPYIDMESLPNQYFCGRHKVMPTIRLTTIPVLRKSSDIFKITTRNIGAFLLQSQEEYFIMWGSPEYGDFVVPMHNGMVHQACRECAYHNIATLRVE